MRYVDLELIWNTEARKASLWAVSAFLVLIGIYWWLQRFKSGLRSMVCDEVRQRQRPLVVAEVTLFRRIPRMMNRIRPSTSHLILPSIFTHLHFLFSRLLLHQNLLMHVKLNQLHHIIHLYMAQLDAFFCLYHGLFMPAYLTQNGTELHLETYQITNLFHPTGDITVAV